MDPKTQWRQTVLEKRQQLTPRFVREASRKVATLFFSLEEFNLAERFGLYSAFHGEVETQAIFIKSDALRKEVFYPAVDSRSREIQFYRVRQLRELQPGYAGILEPHQQKHPLSNIDFLNLIVVPGVAFDKKGNRIGFGGGYYDRLLKNFHGKKVGFAYEFQICDLLPSQSSKDQKMDLIVTEERILRII